MGTYFKFITDDGAEMSGDLGKDLGVTALYPACGQSWPLIAAGAQYGIVPRRLLFSQDPNTTDQAADFLRRLKDTTSWKLVNRPVDLGLYSLYSSLCTQQKVRALAPKRAGFISLACGSRAFARSVENNTQWIAQWADHNALPADLAGALALELMDPCRGRDDPYSKTALSGIAPEFNQDKAFDYYREELANLPPAVEFLTERMCLASKSGASLARFKTSAPFYLFDFQVSWALNVYRATSPAASSSQGG